jgi:Na+-translocating ferredoxin:NAD+ oxidoreductase RnfG subunit
MLCGIIAAGFLALVYFIRQAARAGAENEQMKQVLDDIDKANAVRAALDSDPAAAERLRDRFTR